MKVVVFGSSVAWGQGAENDFGWAARLAQSLEPRGWSLVNKSVPGDNTTKLLSRFQSAVLPEKPQAVILALSLANEGLVRQPDPGAIFFRYRENMRKLVQLCRNNGIVPIVTGVYPHGAYTPRQYEYAKNMNSELDSWDVATVDFMGAVEDGSGHWAEGTFRDPGHPNDAGHEALFRAFPPSLLDGLISWAPLPLRPGTAWLAAPASPEPREGIAYRPLDEMPSFTLAAEVLPDPKTPGILLQAGSVSLSVDAKGNLAAATGTAGTTAPKSTGFALRKDKPVHLAIARNAPMKKNWVFADGKELLSWNDDAASPALFSLGGGENQPAAAASFRNAALYRVALRQDQIAGLASQKFLKSGLEIFSALDDAGTESGTILNNQAPNDAAWNLRNSNFRILREKISQNEEKQKNSLRFLRN